MELLAYANNQKKEGKTDLAKFITNRGTKAVDEALSVGWGLEEAEKKMEHSKTPIFCTAKEELSFVRAGVLDERETEMMRVRWRVSAFSSPISEAEQLQVPPCPRCFAELVYPQS